MSKYRTKTVRIKRIGKVITGSTPPTRHAEYFGDEYPFIKPSDIGDDQRYICDTETKLSRRGHDYLKRQVLPRNAICVVCIGTLGKICLTKEPSFTNQQINSIIVDEPKYNPLFIYYLMQLSIPKVKILDGGSASGRENVNKSSFENIELEIPALFIQEKIAEVLSFFDDLVEVNVERIRIHEEMAQRLYTEWFINFRFPGHENARMIESESGFVPIGWETKNITEVSYFRYIGENISRFNGKKEYFATANIMGTEIVKPGIFYEFENKPSRATKRPLIYSVWFARMKETYKVLGFTEANKNLAESSILSSGFAGFQSKKEHFGFLYNLIRSKQFHKLKDTYCTGATQMALTNDGLSRIRIVLPPKNLIAHYSKIANPIIDQCLILRTVNINLRQTRNLLIPLLISGKIDVNELNIDILSD